MDSLYTLISSLLIIMFKSTGIYTQRKIKKHLPIVWIWNGFSVMPTKTVSNWKLKYKTYGFNFFWRRDPK